MGARGGNRGLVANLSYSVLGQLFYVGSQFAVLSALAHFRGPLAVGEFGLALALASPFFAFSDLGLRTSQAVDVHEEYSFSDYAAVRLVLTLGATIAAVTTGHFYVSSPSIFHVLVIVVLTKAFESVSTLAYGAFQQSNRLDLVAASLFARGALTVPVFIALLLLGASTATALLAQLGVWATIGLVFDYVRASRCSTGRIVFPRWRGLHSLRLLRRSAPLGAGLLANSLQISVPRLVVERYLGIQELGLFTAVGYLQQAGLQASNAVSHALVNQLAHLRRAGETKRVARILWSVAVAIALICLIGCVVAYLHGALILRVFFGAEYARASSLLFVIALAVSVRMLATVPQSYIFARQGFVGFMVFQIAALVVTIACSLTLIPHWHLLGAGYVILASALFRFTVMTIWSKERDIKARPSAPP